MRPEGRDQRGIGPIMSAKIFRPAKNAMQSGRANTQDWRLEYDPEIPRAIDPMMGYTSSSDMKQQIRLSFESREAAIAYAERNGIPYRVSEPHESKRPTIAYADNFKYNRKAPWTH